MLFFVSLFVDGVLVGFAYAPIALAFVVVYKASRMINFALGEWAIMVFSNVASYLVLIAMLFVLRYGMFGRPVVERV